MVMGAIKLCMRLSVKIPRQTDLFSRPIDGRICLKVSEEAKLNSKNVSESKLRSKTFLPASSGELDEFLSLLTMFLC